MMISDLKPAAGDNEEEVEQNIDVDDDVVVYDRSPTSCIIDTVIDPSVILRADAFVLKQQSHPLQLAPFILAIEPDKSVLLEPCRLSYSDWDPEHARVCGALGTYPWSDDYDNVQTHTIGLFAAHPSVAADSDDLIVYIIDGKERDFVDNEDYLECRNAAVDAFKTKVLHLPCFTPHSTHVVDFSRLPANDWIHSSLHVRQCFREFAATMVGPGTPFGSNCNRMSIFSSLSVHVDNCFSSRRDGNAFQSDTLFDGVRIQIARRCWTKDLEVLTTCLINRDNEPTLCANSYCDKHVSRARYCSSTCFTRGWKDHNRLHRLQATTAALDHQHQQQDEEEEEEQEPSQQQQQQHQQQSQQQEQELKPQEHVLLKSVMKGGCDDVADAKALIIGVGIASPPATSDSSRIDRATGPTAGAVNGMYEAAIELSVDLPVHEMKAKAEKEGKLQVPAKATVRIAGATGYHASEINGMYEVTSEMSGDMPVYVKVDGGDMWLEYHAAKKHWQVKPTAAKGKDGAMASCAVPAKCSPEQCPTGQWQIYVNGKIVLLPAIVISVVTREEVDAHRAQVEEEAARVLKGSDDVIISGATGQKAGIINGIYKPTDELCGNVTVYVKEGDDDMCLEHHAAKKQWQVKSIGDKRTGFSWAFCAVPVKCLPEDCPRGKWLVDNGNGKWGPQQTVTISVQRDNSEAVNTVDIDDDDEAKPRAAAMKVDTSLAAAKTAGLSIASPAASGGVCIAGTTGPAAGVVNGMYEATAELSGDMPVYVKVGSSDMCLEYSAGNKQWQLKPTSAKGTYGCSAFCDVPVKCLPQDCPAGQWRVAADGKLVPQCTVAISDATQEEVETYRAEVVREAARVVEGGRNVRITGVMSSNARLINGVYKPTAEFCDNVTVYVNVGDGDMWLEYNATSKQWQVKSTSSKGKGGCFAFCAVPAKCLPEDCPRGKWLVDNGAKWRPQQTVTITVQRDNNGPVSANDVDDDDDEAKPKAAAKKVDLGAATAGMGITTSATSGGVRIVGATGTNAGCVNGMYKPTDEMCGDLPVYIKVGDPDRWLQYDAAHKRWHVKSTSTGRTDVCMAGCAVPAKCLPEDCPKGHWIVWEVCNLVPQPAVTITVVTQEEVKAYIAEVERESTRVLKGIHHVRVTGATGIFAGSINGIYRPTQELCGNVTVYVKVEDGDMWLEYRALLKHWQLKPIAGKGTDTGLAYCTVPAKCLPEECPRGSWYVHDTDKMVSQPAITIKQKKRER